MECGIAAIDHGADAVYIGADCFGARAAARNPIDDIRKLCRYAHIFRAKVYATVNTIIYDNELSHAEALITELYNAGIDAVLIQDMGLLKLNLPPIALHASTQTDNRTIEKVRWLATKGFSRVVLARELSSDEISKIHSAEPDIELEVFVHGALCVSYSGQCYASQYCFNRSANRGECAQFCRLKFNLEDADHNVIVHNRYLLSLKDLCLYDRLETLMQAGATSFKIEGRLKDVTYVKNVTAAYSEKLNEIIAKHPRVYHRASIGECQYTFKPNLNKTFNRGFTHYFLDGRKPDITSFDTPKAKGEYVGRVKEIRKTSFNVAGTSSFANGDGLCFFNNQHELEGFRVNNVINNRIFPLRMPQELRSGTVLYRNNDHTFEQKLSHISSERKINVSAVLSETDEGFSLTLGVKGIAEVCTYVNMDKQTAIKPQTENITKQLTKLGNTPFICNNVILQPVCFNFFLPSSVLADLRRCAVEKLTTKLQNLHDDTALCQPNISNSGKNIYPDRLSYLYNVSNQSACSFYNDDGKKDLQKAFELEKPTIPLLMQCRHCIRYSLGFCIKSGGHKPTWREPLYLRSIDGHRFRLQFNCLSCQMNIYADERP